MINSLRLQNFKNFRNVTLPLGPLTVIVGANASGKSNLRDAFRFIHGMSRDYSLADIVGEKFSEGMLQWRGIRGGAKEIASFGQSSFSIETNFQWKSSGRVDIYRHNISVDASSGIHALTVSNESLYKNNIPVYYSSASNESLNLVRPGSLLVFAGQFDEPAAYSSAKPVLGQILRNPVVPQDTKFCSLDTTAEMNSMRFLDLAPEAMKIPSVPGQELGDRGENLSSALQAICEDPAKKEAVKEWIRQLTPVDVVDFEFPADQAGKVLIVLVEESGKRTSAYSASDGTLRFLAMLAALMGPDAPHFYFLEEIDNGIHPTRLNLLIELLEQHSNEDFRKDQYIGMPIVRRIFKELRKPRVQVVVCTDPRIRNISQALDWQRISVVIDKNPIVNVFLLLVDRDGIIGRREALNAIESQAKSVLSVDRTLIGENAWQEIEVWALAGQSLPKEWSWQTIRNEVHPKETFFIPHALRRGLNNEPGEGRTTLGREAAQNYDRVRSRCKEDIQVLEMRLKDWIDNETH